MKRIGIAIGVLALGVALYGLGSRAEAKPDDVAEIKTVEEGIATAAKARDLDTIMKNYPRGDTLVVFDVAPPRQYLGYDTFRKDWQHFLDMFSDPITYEMVDLNIRVTDVLRKTNGRWLIIHEHASFPVDMATGKADFLSKP
jgi:ketosteroid isomerase-like protein